MPYKEELSPAGKLYEKFEQSKSQLGTEEQEKRGQDFKRTAERIKTLDQELAKISQELENKIFVRRDVLKSAQELAAWLSSEHKKMDEKLLLSIEPDAVVAIFQRV